jgi:hypothetical protein
LWIRLGPWDEILSCLCWPFDLISIADLISANLKLTNNKQIMAFVKDGGGHFWFYPMDDGTKSQLHKIQNDFTLFPVLVSYLSIP